MNDHATESEFDNVYGCRHSLNDGVMRVSDAMFRVKCELVCGHGDVGNGCAFAFSDSRVRVLIADCDFSSALQACVGISRRQLLSASCLGWTSPFRLTGNFNTVTWDHMKI